MDEIFRNRIVRCTDLMQKNDLDALILTKPANMLYLTGDGRLCAYAMVTRKGEVAMGVPQTDIEDVKQSARADFIVGFYDEVGLIHSVAHFFKHFGMRDGKVGLEYAFLPQPRLGMFTHPHAKPKEMEAKDCTPLMSELRLVKEDGEIDRMQKAADVAAVGMQAAQAAIRPGITENDIAAAADYAMRQAGATDLYRSYVAAGPRTNIAHGLPSLRKIKKNDLVMIDLHPVVEGYSSDLCRIVCAGDPSPEQQQVYDLYVSALEATIKMAKEGVAMMDLEQNMHSVFKKAGHGDHIFGPPIHGIGIEFEESPLPAGHAFFHGEKVPSPLLRNVVIAIGNCGLYTGQWGIREEDTVAVGQDGPLVLTQFKRQLSLKG